MAIDGLNFSSGTGFVTQGAFDTSVGLVKITDSTFATSTAVNVNNCFTSTYDNYLLLVFLTAASATDTNINLYLRASGTDTTTGYFRALYYNDGTTLTGLQGTSSLIASTSTSNPTDTTFQVTLFRPQDAVKKVMHFTSTWVTNAGVGPQVVGGLLRQAATTQFDGFSLVPASGNISGTFRVYGYRD